ncbi:MAG: hypothetical protein KIS94_06170 [Chitinophagales bacterium]|nr:hypothetical protein [Chitinophagales bacterium]
MKPITAALALLISVFFVETVQAHPHKQHRYAKHHAHQQQRIKHGMATGQLTQKEAAQLQLQQAQVRHSKKLAQLDGRITHCERAHLKAEQARLNQNIFIQKHDRQTR